MKIRITSMLIAMIFLLSSAVSTAAAPEQSTAAMRMQPMVEKLSAMTDAEIQVAIDRYRDIKNHWGRVNIGKLSNLGILSSNTGLFNPEGNMTVAQYLKVIVRSLGYKIAEPSGAKWYKPYVDQALKDKLIDANEFKDYGKYITREQAASIIYKAAVKKEPAPENQGYFTIMRWRITDYAYISDKYKDSFVKAYLLGYFELPANGGAFPQNNLTRAQACTIVIRLLDEKAKVKFAPQEDEYYVWRGETIYPASNVEPIKVFNHLLKNKEKSKGYLFVSSLDSTVSSFTFYESEEERNTQFLGGQDATLEIRNTTRALAVNWPYFFSIGNSKAFFEYHEAFLKDFFTYLFEKDGNKAYTEFEKYLTSQQNEAKSTKTLKIGDRYIDMTMFGTSASVFITCKGGKNTFDF